VKKFMFLIVMVVALHAYAVNPPLPLGVATLVSGPSKCNRTYECYVLNISCPGVAQNINVTLRVGTHSGTYKGTITYHSQGAGDAYWAGGKVPTNAQNNLRSSGFRSVDFKWSTDWTAGSTDALEGLAKLSCRPATALKWVYDNLHTSPSSTAFCSTGNSFGAAQVTYPLSHYGLDYLFAAVLPTGGPPTSRMDYSCLPSSGYPNYDAGAKQSMDATYGFAPGTGPCVNADSSFIPNWQTDSSAYGDQDFYHPTTAFGIIVGVDDAQYIHAQSDFHFERLQQAGSPIISKSVVPNVGHPVPYYKDGATAIVNYLKAQCLPH
jgi:hypothetical protein